MLQRAVISPISQISSLNQTLVIGNLTRWKSEGRITVALSDFQFAEFGALTSDMLKSLAPEIVLSPLMGDDFDVLDVAQKLLDLGFEGRYRVVADRVPNTQMILTEVRNHAPGLDFDLMLMPKASNDGKPKCCGDPVRSVPRSLGNGWPRAANC